MKKERERDRKEGTETQRETVVCKTFEAKEKSS
jgi:hypothetical protein